MIRSVLPVVTAVLLALTPACGGGGLRRCDAVENELQQHLALTLRAMQTSDLTALRGEKEQLVRLRLRAGRIKLPAAQAAARDTLVRALDAVVDAVTSAGLGIEASRAAGDSSASAPSSLEDLSPDQLKERAGKLRESAAHLEECRARLDRAYQALQHLHAMRGTSGSADGGARAGRLRSSSFRGLA